MKPGTDQPPVSAHAAAAPQPSGNIETEFLDWLCTGIGVGRYAAVTAVIVAHPDDQVIGAGSRLPLLRGAWFIHVTDGAARDGREAHANGFDDVRLYAVMRRREMYEALALAGIGSQRVQMLDWPEQEAALHLAELSQQIAQRLRELGPLVVLTQPYEGGHPDHDATAFAVHAATRLLERDGVMPPRIIEMAAYHSAESGQVETAQFLPGNAGPADNGHVTLVLSEHERIFKEQLLDHFRTQRELLSRFLPAEIERFRRAPHYRFDHPPHAGKLYYEQHPWGMTGERFVALASAALKELGLSG